MNATPVVLETAIPGLQPCLRGKVRDVYDLGDRLLIVATDRISAFDSVLPTGIPDKGRVLTQLSAFWFGQTAGFCPNHCLATDDEALREALRPFTAQPPLDQLSGRSMLARKTRPLPVECIVRGYLDGSAWKEYRSTGSVCGIPLPAGLQQGSRLPQPLFTPSTKAASGHDENITHAEMARILPEATMARCIELSLAVYNHAAAFALERGAIIADTKFEFGVPGEGDADLLMIDECLTPDSSRFWDAALHRPGGPQPSWDKQYVRDYLDSIGWNHEPPAPPLPPEVVERTAEKYRELYRRITGHALP
jgi:phosphoribosylaminoimidazole-succinocarboxamide synthase